MNLTKKEIISMVGAAASFLLFMFFLDVNIDFLINLQFSVFEILGGNLSPQMVKTLVSIFFFILGLSFLSVGGYYNDNNKIGFVSLVILPFIILRFSIMQIFLLLGVVISSLFIISLANTYGQELKKWKYFRVGSNSVGKALFVFNIIIAVGVFVVISSNLSFYQDQFRNTFVETFVASIPLPENASEADLERAREQIPSLLESIPLFGTIVEFLAPFTAFTVWITLEVIKQFGSLLAGVITSILIRIYNKVD